MYETRNILLSLAASSVRVVRFTHFLQPDGQVAAYSAAKQAGVSAISYGGYADSERQIVAFSRANEPWPIDCLRISWNDKFGDLRHRDILGSIIGLGIKREFLGDIRMGGGSALVYCEQSISTFLLENLTKAGRSKISVARGDNEAFTSIDTEERTRIVVQSPRIDSVLAETYKISRSEAGAMIMSGLVFYNYETVSKASTYVAVDGLLSVRGFGRIHVEAMQTTKKGRWAVFIRRTV